MNEGTKTATESAREIDARRRSLITFLSLRALWIHRPRRALLDSGVMPLSITSCHISQKEKHVSTH